MLQPPSHHRDRRAARDHRVHVVAPMEVDVFPGVSLARPSPKGLLLVPPGSPPIPRPLPPISGEGEESGGNSPSPFPENRGKGPGD